MGTDRYEGVYDSARCSEAVGKVSCVGSERPRGNEGLVDGLWELDADESKIGLQEKSAPNNHGAAYDVQLSAVLVMAEKEEEAKKVLGESLPARLDAHITPEGKQPRELARTKSWSYSCFNLKNICKGAVIRRSFH